MKFLFALRGGYASVMAATKNMSKSSAGGAAGVGGTGGGLSTFHCVKCEYNVTGLSSGVCPSCGTRFAEEGALPAKQLEQPSFLRGLLALYVLTGPGVVLLSAFKSPGLIVGLAACALLAQPTCALLLGVAYGMRWTAGKRRWVRVLACAALMVSMIGASLIAWGVAMSFLGHPLSTMSRG